MGDCRNCQLFADSECDSSCASTETVLITFGVVLVCFFSFWCFLFCHRGSEGPDQENLEMIENQDQVIKTYQVAKMIISAFESL